jgi:hypothetical protein
VPEVVVYRTDRLGHIGGTEHQSTRVNSGQSRVRDCLVEGSLRARAAGPEPACFALLRQRFGLSSLSSLQPPPPPQGRPCGRPEAALRPGDDTTLTGEPASPLTHPGPEVTSKLRKVAEGRSRSTGWRLPLATAVGGFGQRGGPRCAGGC